MHMADALLSPAVGGVMTAVSAGALGYSVKKITGNSMDEKKIPMMAVMGALVFAGQMINFTIPGTGSSGHIGGGILLAATLGPFPALLTLAAVLLIQCLFFADGGLLTYGCNVFNMGVCACFLGYYLIWKPMMKHGLAKGKGITTGRITAATIFATVVGLQVGAFCVVLETTVSGITELPFGSFAILMQPIHLAIGLVEGLVTAGVLCFLARVRPEILESALQGTQMEQGVSIKKVGIALLVAALVMAGGLSLLASQYPDGLEWSMEGVAGTAELDRETGASQALGEVVDSTAFLPDYAFPDNASVLGTAVSGLVGSAITIGIAGGIGAAIHFAKKKKVKHE